MDLSLLVFVSLICVAFVAGLISAIAGSGGLIVLPALLTAGLPPLNALATNKFQSVFGTLSSAINFFQKGHIDLPSMKLSLFCAFIGASFGTLSVQLLNTQWLEIGLPYFLLCLAVYVAWTPAMSDQDQPEKMSAKTFDVGVGSSVGFYGGFLGPGMGSFCAIAFSSLRGFNLKKATAHTKPLVLVTNTTSIVVFVLAGKVVWSLAIIMAVAQFAGARIGSNLVMDRGAKFIKPVLISVIVLLSAKLILLP